MAKTWMVRAKEGGRLFDVFKEKSVIAIGWTDIGSLESLTNREQIAERVAETWPDWRPRTVNMSAGQLFRFRKEMQVGDRVVTYDPSRRVYLLGTISSDYRFDPTIEEDAANARSVKWDGEVLRDLLSVATKNSLGAISTLFVVPDEAAADLERALNTKQPISAKAREDTKVEENDLFKDIRARAVEFIKDSISELDWDEMQELIAGLLRAMGYKTRVSPSGPDRGRDIIASPDGFGFESPRIVVEVKHRNQTIGTHEVRSFLGGRHIEDKGLYVSTGGFSKEAYYEADRASIPLTLMNLDDLVEALMEHYEQLDVQAKQLLPLKRIYWPV
jgi:restriction system protein